MRLGFQALLALLLWACSDDGHVVGDMATDGSAGSSNGSSSGGSGNANSSGSGSLGDATSSSSGTSDAGSTNSNSATTAGSDVTSSSTTAASGGTGGASTNTDASSGGGSTGDTTGGTGGTGTSDTGGAAGDTTGGTGGTSTSGTGGTAGTGGTCPSGQMWCPSCYQGEGICAQGCPGGQCAPCSYEDTEERCVARIDCHPVYEDSGQCGCGTPGCCAQFSSCAPGVTADCIGQNLACTVREPYCDSPTYVISYANACYEGCVKAEDCSSQ